MLTDKQKLESCIVAMSQYVDDLRTHTHCDHVLARHIIEFENLMQQIEYDYETDNTSRGLIDLLDRHGFKSTGDLFEDLAIAKSFMPKRYGETK